MRRRHSTLPSSLHDAATSSSASWASAFTVRIADQLTSKLGQSSPHGRVYKPTICVAIWLNAKLNAKGRPEGSPWCQVSARQRPKADVPRDTHDEAPVTSLCSHAIVTSVTQTYRQSGNGLGKTASLRFSETRCCYPAISANAIIAQTRHD